MLIGHGTAYLDVVLGEPMGGYADRSGGVAGTHDRLEIHAVTFTQGDATFALIVADIVCVNNDLVAQIRQSLAASCGITHCWVTATHTHAGPESGCRPGGSATEPGLSARVVDAALAAVRRAAAATVVSSVSVARASVTNLAGRRAYEDADAPMPLDAMVIRARSGIVGVIAVSPIHPTVTGARNRQCSADLNGGIRRALERQLRTGGRDTPWVVVATGAAGDISTRHTRRARTWAEIDRLADRAAAALALAITTEPGAEGRPDQIRSVITRRVTVKLAPKSPTHLPDRPLPLTDPHPDRNELTYRQGWRLATEILDAARPEFHPVALETVRLGDIDLLAVPAELFLSLAEQIRQSAPSPEHFLFFGYANGYLGYLPDRAAYLEPAYEVLVSPVAPGSGELVAQAATELLRNGAIDSPDTEGAGTLAR